MDTNQFRAAVNSMSESDLSEVINALDRARDHAVQLTHSARLPECAAFGAVAADLEYGLRIICQSATAENAVKGTNAKPAQAIELIALGLDREPVGRT